MTEIRTIVLGALILIGAASPLVAEESSKCDIPKGVVEALQSKLASVVTLANGGIFNNLPNPGSSNRMWSAVVDRKNQVCSVIVTGDAWPGSRAIAIAKAGTANDFSNDALALSTANLYPLIQPGGSLYGLNNSNPFNPEFLEAGKNVIGRVAGGIITFGGGVPLYSNGKVIGGLGLSGDTACADHAIAYRMRAAAGLNGTPGPGQDNIVYGPGNHPQCLGAGVDVVP
jgi:uncharacterized protein GlcG (DUF336 family)